MTDPARVQLLAEMAARDGASIELVVERTEEAMQRDGLGTTISEEAMEQLHFEMSAWVGSRLMRAYDRTRIMPQKVSVVLTVALDTDEL